MQAQEHDALTLGTPDIWDQIILHCRVVVGGGGGVSILYIGRCLVASLASSHKCQEHLRPQLCQPKMSPHIPSVSWGTKLLPFVDIELEGWPITLVVQEGPLGSL